MARSKTTDGALAETLKRALLAQRGGQTLQAELLYSQMLEESPEHPAALNLLGALRCQQGDAEGGLQLFERALRAKPDFADALNSRGNALRDLGRPAVVAPANLDALLNCGAALQDLGRHAEALERLQRALAIAPRDADLLIHIGMSLRALGREEDALERYQRALKLRPDHVDALNNSGNVLKTLDRIEEAIAAYRRAIALNPANPEFHHNLGLALLSAGDWEQGWREYEWRLGTRQFAGFVRQFKQPLWQGESGLAGRTILLHAEQGLGDGLMFARFVPLVAGRGGRVVLEAPPPLAPLFEGIEGVAQLSLRGGPLPEFDLHCPLPSLPLVFGTTRRTVPAPISYRAAAGAEVSDWEGILAEVPRPRVGIVWAGDPRNSQDRYRSMDLARLGPVLSVPGIGFVSLQKEVSARDSEILARHGVAQTGTMQRNLADASVLIEKLDLVLSVDTAIAHLAGSMGKPLWLMLAHVCDWRWGRAGEGTPWYPQARLFRQDRRADWNGPTERIVEALRCLPAGAGRANDMSLHG